MSKFADEVRSYLEGYKNKILLEEIQRYCLDIQEIPEGIYRYKGKFDWKKHVLPVELKYSVVSKLPDDFKPGYEKNCAFIQKVRNCLKIDTKYLNILPVFRNRFIEYIESSSVNKKTKLHKGFHHLNSSQAMCMNFFYPLLAERKLDLVLGCLSSEFSNESVNYDSIEFEKDGDDKYSPENYPTNFDFYCQTVSGKNVYFEIKYTEDRFTSVNCNEQKYKDKFEHIYGPRLKTLEEKKVLSLFNQDEHDEEEIRCVFFKNYQILRNLLAIDDDSYVVFVYPSDNTKIKKQAKAAKEFLLDDYKNHLILLTWKDLVDSVRNQLEGLKGTENLQKHFGDFHVKYLNYGSCINNG